MGKIEKIDVKENLILKLSEELLSVLLKDRTTKKNIIWATDNYENKGSGYFFNDNIYIELITGINGEVIKPRTKKNKIEQNIRIKEKGEVFTPSWVCNKQNNLVDENWFGYKNPFNVESSNGWKAKKTRVKFPEGKNWQDYVKSIRMEMTCGEAPYLTSRYDTVTGNVIEVKDRIGLLDRKLRIINENVSSKEEWLYWVKEAYKSIYGYEWQGDNLLLARENLLYSFRDNYYEMYGDLPDVELELEIAEIISWNLWQMDGVKLVVPNSCENSQFSQLTLFGIDEKIECIGCTKDKINQHNGTYSRIMNWKTNKPNKFLNIVMKGSK